MSIQSSKSALDSRPNIGGGYLLKLNTNLDSDSKQVLQRKVEKHSEERVKYYVKLLWVNRAL